MGTKASETARRYYDRDDVNGFYTAVWGGENIHIGMYSDAGESVATAARRTVTTMAGMVAEHLGPGRMVLDLGAGYGGPARHLATHFGGHIVAVNISGVQNRRHHEINAARRSSGHIDIVTASFEELPFGDGQFDVVWSQDALSHSDDQGKALREARRVLEPDGRLIFTDLMAANDAAMETLRSVIARTCAESLPTPGSYYRQLTENGFAPIDFIDYSGHLLTHYRTITAETRRRATDLAAHISPPYLEGLLENLPLWVNACRDGRLRWGIFHCRAA
ncbi:SAM-dependent methyltransferase [Nocardia sp. GCM10030253]|uniref:SAM-dependent methyltransferase n=1 Tax=Nocardia sp. GCM10030253 TaxID=3273404 RepID=UPI00362F33BF